jgi:hypothetical protein
MATVKSCYTTSNNRLICNNQIIHTYRSSLPKRLIGVGETVMAKRWLSRAYGYTSQHQLDFAVSNKRLSYESAEWPSVTARGVGGDAQLESDQLSQNFTTNNTKFADTEIRIVTGVVLLKTVRFHCYIIYRVNHYYISYFTGWFLHIKMSKEVHTNVYGEGLS